MTTSPITIKQAGRPTTQPPVPLVRSYTEPNFRTVHHAKPSKLVEALDVTAHKRSKSSMALSTLPPPTVVAPKPPQADEAAIGRMVHVRSIINNVDARERALAARGLAKSGAPDPRMLHMPLLQVFADNAGTVYLMSPPVRGGAHGEFHFVRREFQDGRSDLWAAKQVRMRSRGGSIVGLKDSIAPREPHDISREICAMLTARSPIVPRMLLRHGDRIFACGPACDGDLSDVKSEIDQMDSRTAELFLIDIALQVSRRLQACHENMLTHRDIKPENILYKRNGQVYLADFSYVAHTTDKPSGYAGTLGFIAPEHLDTGSLDPKIDIFSLGATLLDLIAYTPFEPGYIPGPADSESALLQELTLGFVPQRSPEHALARFAEWEDLYRAWSEDPQGREFSSVFPDLDTLFASVQQRFPNLFEVLLDMIATDPSDRYNAEDLVKALQELPRSAHDGAVLSSTWASIPRAKDLDAIYQKWCEPHLPKLRRAASVDNLPRLQKTISVDNALLQTFNEI